MRINNSPMNIQKTNPNFQAKFLHSESLRLIADYAKENGKFEALNIARKNISTSNLTTRIRVDIGENLGRPFVTFSKFVPRKKVRIAKTMDDYKLAKTEIYESGKHQNPLKFALEKIIKLGNDAPNNKMFRRLVIEK